MEKKRSIQGFVISLGKHSYSSDRMGCRGTHTASPVNDSCLIEPESNKKSRKTSEMTPEESNLPNQECELFYRTNDLIALKIA